tara:strand:- start:2636 stop:2977 length:342 start_codon:yes stop_codon:yes gene_type:complete
MKQERSAYEPDERVDTHEIVYKMTQIIGGLKRGNLSKTARIYGTSRSRLDSILRRKAPAPTLDTLSIWIGRLYRRTGVRVVLTVTPDMRIYYSIRDQRNERLDGVILKNEHDL